ncbi:MAG: sensor histidine kinase [Anaerolineales bacterium]
MLRAELLAQETALHHRRLILTRWIAAGGLLGVTGLSAVLGDLALPIAPLVALGVFILAYNALLSAAPAPAPPWDAYIARTRRRILWHIGLDWFSLAVFWHLTGGITSPALVFFFIHVIIVTILYQSPWSYAYGLLVWLTVGALALAEAAGGLAHHAVLPALPADLYRAPGFIAAQMAFFGVTVLTIVLLIDSIMAPGRRREAQLAALFETTQAVSATLELPDVLAELSHHACRSLDARGATIRLLDASQRYLDLTAEHGTGYFTQARITIAQGSPHEAALAGQVMDVTPDTMRDYPHELILKGTRQALLVPIRGTRALGLLSIYFANPVPVDATMRRFADAIAGQGAAAISNALAHDALHKAEKQREQFVHIVTHELRSPVGAAQSLLRAMNRRYAEHFNDQQRDILSRLAGRMDALQTLINDLLSLAESKARDLQEPLQRLDAAPIIARVAEGYTVQAREKDLAYTVEIPAEAVTVLATETGLVRVADNLIGNAIKYTPAGGQVSVCLGRDGLFSVQDTGIGIPQDSLDKLGAEFFRSSNAKASGITGTGLGLATVQGLLDRFGGALRVESEVDVGTTMYAQLPLAEG